jgi:hypothetical protein
MLFPSLLQVVLRLLQQNVNFVGSQSHVSAELKARKLIWGIKSEVNLIGTYFSPH